MDAVVDNKPQLLKGLYKLTPAQRWQRLVEAGWLTAADQTILDQITSDELHQLADHFIENSIGCLPIPLGVVPGLVVDDQEVVVPMAVEETSIVAGCSKMAKWLRESGEVTTRTEGTCAIGQIYFPKVNDIMAFIGQVDSQKQALMACANQDVAEGLVKRGGGVKDITVRTLLEKPGEMKAVVHVMIDTCDAMGANIINQVCEYLRHPLQELTGEDIAMCIVSNLPDTKLTKARIVIHDIDPQLGYAIEEASHFAELDPYRAATSNKGVMNGIDAVLIATGNDWRAVEAGVHAYAARSGQYRSITRWRMQGDHLVGDLEAPIITGCVGGVTKLHPIAKIALKLMKIEHADQLSRIVAAVGLLQNLAAINALVGDGIVKGHMKLHIKNLLLSVDATATEQVSLQPLLEKHLQTHNKVSLSDAIHLLAQLRVK
ncbi:MAG: hydroxymethylglutaryl-CoA reductase, degradative [Coxiellaceae bacterium]|nr:hydroxymethylglutaryl-CoA reductase, degradative [Coxiellaceae bacterium]